jgi:hypothetical protein
LPDEEEVRVDRERWLLRVDRLAAGRHATHRIDDGLRTDPRTRAAFTRVAWLLLAEFLIGAGAVGEAFSLSRSGHHISPVVWWRLVVIFAIATTLFYFVWRARLGFWWAYSRLRLFSLVFPVVAVTTCLIPGLYPEWMVIEQLVFSAVLLLVRLVLSTPHLRAAYTRPPRVPVRDSV